MVALHDSVEWFWGQFQEEELLDRPDMIGQPGGHGRCPFEGVMDRTEFVDHTGLKQFIL